LLLQSVTPNFTEIGQGDCDDYDEITLGRKPSALECMQDCYDRGFFMASWNGNCYCEENPKSYPCQTYTDMEGYVNWMWHDPGVIPQILSCPQDIYDRAYVNAQGLQNGIEREIFSTSVFTIRTYNSGTFCDEFNL
jgi:hypothetical protein